MTSYIVATTKPWNRAAFHTTLRHLPGKWALAMDREELDTALLRYPKPRYIFFPHWNWNIPVRLLEKIECVAFHATALPFGRGGSPIQNLIQRGYYQTALTAFKVVGELDGGPIYLQRHLSLDGGGEEIYLRMAALTANMIEDIVTIQDRWEPYGQIGKPVVFKRRTPKESRITFQDSFAGLHDHIRMLDADGYPPAFFIRGVFRYTFRNPVLRQGRLEALVEITLEPTDD